MAASPESYDLLILVDATYSMASYLKSLQRSLPQIISISTLTGCFSRIGILAYKDYCDRELLSWSGWLWPSDLLGEHSVDLIATAKALSPMGGGDGPEATKTGLARAYELMREQANTLILLYTDAPPHTESNGSLTDSNSNHGPEQRALAEATSYGGFGPHFRDWVSAAKFLQSASKRSQVFCILERDMAFEHAGYYNYLSEVTGGVCLYLADSRPGSISKVTVELLLAWMGAEKIGAAATTDVPAFLTRYTSVQNIASVTKETNSAARRFFQASRYASPLGDTGASNITKTRVSFETLKAFLPQKPTPVADFARRYVTDLDYKKIVTEHIKRIIEEDVSTISLNPVFGSLWRSICNDRDNEAREDIVTAFSRRVDLIADAEEKARMKSWLEESYDYSAEVTSIIASVPDSEQFPCVCLDPTLVFTRGSNEQSDPTEDIPITQFRRDELLEIGRSCDYRILRRLGRLLTRLTYIRSATELPAHLKSASTSEICRIPIALASPGHKRQFWRILLHIVVPGTMLSARPAALLAALSIHIGVEPLFEAALQELSIWRDRWNDLTIPETWNVSCLGLLIDADTAYRARVAGTNSKGNAASGSIEPLMPSSILNTPDRALFEQLVLYKMLERNMETSLTARIGWTPAKAAVPIGPSVVCKSCEFPRSITIMGAGGNCGHCLWTEFKNDEERDACVNARVNKADTEQTPATWVECNLRACRAQYVVYRPENLNVKPKCHYCRYGKIAPVLECSICLNRVIWPMEYRSGVTNGFTCYACVAGRETVTRAETTAKELTRENGTTWLVRDGGRIAEPLSNRSLFHTISTIGLDIFRHNVELLPSSPETELRLQGKVIQNALEMTFALETWARRRRTENGTCSLCLSDYRKSELVVACGRSGCRQRVCRNCLETWYGNNRSGEIINPASLSCPFCRRPPSGRTLAKFGLGIHAVGNLRSAMEDAGGWIYAWCSHCSHARRYAERICAAGAPAPITNWSCDQCESFRDARAQQTCYKACPGCGTMTERTGGCGHITCPVPACETHWCFFCGGKFSADTIYDHMSVNHDGLYGDDEDGEEHEGELDDT